MKVVASTLLALSLSADAFVIQTKNPSSSTTSLNDIGLQWGYDERGRKKEYYLEDWYERNRAGMQHAWAYDPWSCIGQVLTGDIPLEFSTKDINSPPAPAQQAASLPPAEKAQPMPEAQVPAAQDAAQMV